MTRPVGGGGVAPNLADYERVRAAFSWDGARSALDGLPDGRGLNIAYEAVDWHVAGPGAGRVALRFLRRDGTSQELTFAGLAAETNRFADVLRGLCVRSGEWLVHAGDVVHSASAASSTAPSPPAACSGSARSSPPRSPPTTGPATAGLADDLHGKPPWSAREGPKASVDTSRLEKAGGHKEKCR